MLVYLAPRYSITFSLLEPNLFLFHDIKYASASCACRQQGGASTDGRQQRALLAIMLTQFTRRRFAVGTANARGDWQSVFHCAL